MASGTIKTNGVVHHGIASGTTDTYGRLVTSISGDFSVINALIEGQSYSVTPYIYRNIGNPNGVINFIVAMSQNANRVANTEVTIHYYYINN